MNQDGSCSGTETRHPIKTREDLDEQQREYFLQQQIKNIKEELGNGEGSPERKELLDKALKKKWSKEVEATFLKEIDKLDMLNPARARVQRTAELPANHGLSSLGVNTPRRLEPEEHRKFSTRTTTEWRR